MKKDGVNAVGMKQTALFLSNSIYFDTSRNEGGVRLCTEEYHALIEQLFQVIDFPVDYQIDIAYRVRARLGINIYHGYKPENYRAALKEVIVKNNIQHVFLNLSNCMVFAPLIKELFHEKVKVIVCSHGNESGDFLHEATRFQLKMPFYKTLLSSFALGSMLKKEAAYRQQFLDAVLTVSPVEEALENWIGAKQVMMVPRTVKKESIQRNAIPGRVGFMGDLSHWPNFFGVDELCKAMSGLKQTQPVEIRVVGAPAKVGEELAAKYPFVTYMGYLNKAELDAEIKSWAFFLNPVFYYSRGVSTKLAKALGWGMPVITTTIGYRGYKWNKGSLVIAETATAMAQIIIDHSADEVKMKTADEEVKLLTDSIKSIEEIGKELQQFLKSVS